MSKLIKELRKKIDVRCIIERSKEKVGRRKCKVSLEGAPKPHLVVDCDLPGAPRLPKRKICDFLMVAMQEQDWHWIVPIEIKRGPLHSASHAVEQIQAGTDAIQKYLSTSDRIDLFPVVVSSTISKDERKQLRDKANRVKLKHLSREALYFKCGESIAFPKRT